MIDNWKTVILTTPRLILRPWQESDAEALFRFGSDPLVGPPAGWKAHATVEESLAFIRTILAARENYAVLLRYDTRDAVSGEVIAAGTPVGGVGICFNGCGSYPHTKQTEAEIGYWVSVPLWGRGLIPEAVGAIQERCFTTLGLDGLWCGYYAGNEKSRRVQEKCGFTPRCALDIPPHPLNGATVEYFSYMSREDWELTHAPVTHEMSLRESPFRAVASGKKTVEMRLFDPKRQLIREGDEIRFTLVGSAESVTAEVIGLHYFPSFIELYDAFLSRVGAEGLGYAEGEAPHPEDMLDYYSEDSITRYGVIGIEIKLKEN